MKKVALFILLFGTTICFSQNKPGLKLWYKQPSGETWENALPIGNGRLGAMIYGNVEKEIIQLNEHSVWSGSPNRNDNPLALDVSFPCICFTHSNFTLCPCSANTPAKRKNIMGITFMLVGTYKFISEQSFS